jgi:DNA-binding LytR/AlgR family response regulator
MAGVMRVTFKIAVCDDEESELDKIGEYLTKFSLQYGYDFETGKYNCGEDLLEKYDSTGPYDIIFLDMEMGGKSGIRTAEAIRSRPDRNVLIIFITNYPEYMQDSFDVQAYQYLTKPVSYGLFSEKLSGAISYMEELETNITVVNINNDTIVLHTDDIVCVETRKTSPLKSEIDIVTVNETFAVKGKLADFESELSEKHFIRIHRSCLANMKYIKRFRFPYMEFTTGRKTEISRRRLGEVKAAFSKYMVLRTRK